MSTEQTEATSAQSVAKTATTYIILALDKTPETGKTWTEMARLGASSREAAIRAYCEQTVPNAAASPLAMVLVAVPARSFNPVRVTPKQATTLVIEEA